MRSALLKSIFTGILCLCLGTIVLAAIFQGSIYNSHDEFVKLVKSGREFILIDVRKPESFKQGHLPGAMNIDSDHILDSVPTADKNALILLYCNQGIGSKSAGDTLRSKGFLNAHGISLKSLFFFDKYNDLLVTD